jgi:TIR domain
MASFITDIFISYAQLDNEPLSPDDEGWVSRFHASLARHLAPRLGEPARIWRDDSLQGNDVFPDEIVQQLAGTALLVSVLTPRYLLSEWCTREIREFCERAEATGGVVVNNKARVFKVFLLPVDTQDGLPSVVKDTLGYEFFTREDGAPFELDDPAARAYKLKVGKLAWEMKQLLDSLETHSGGKVSYVQAPAEMTVYLAQCSYDQQENREILETELRRLGYAVLPDRELPGTESEYVAAVETLLARCKLSIHLIGAKYGAVPSGPSERSVVVLQNELAVQRSRNGGLARVIWLPEGTHSEHELQQAFIEALHEDAGAQFGADLITADVEAVKTLIHSRLKNLEKLERQSPEGGAAADGVQLIYLICTEKDRKATIPARKYLLEHGFEVELPAFEGDATAIRDAHRQLMTDCDAVLLYYGAGDEAWKRTVDNDLRKMAGYERGKRLLAKYTYLAEPITSDKKELIELGEPALINGIGEVSEVGMDTFLQAIKTSAAAP